MAIPVTTTFAAPNPDFCPESFAQLVTYLNLLVASEAQGSFTPYVVQDSSPTVAQQGYIWFKTVSGKPIGTYKYYDGLWRKIYTGSIGDVKMFSGDPAPVFDGTGKGIPGGEQDGWYLCNGLNATPNLSDKFIVAAHMDNSGGTSGYAGGWKSDVEGTDTGTGGAAEVTLDATTGYFPARPEIKVYSWQADGNTPDADGGLFGEVTTPGSAVTLQTSDDGNTAPDPFFILPPWYSLALAQFKGY